MIRQVRRQRAHCRMFGSAGSSSTSRDMRGAVLAEGVVGIALVALAMIIGLVPLADAALCMYYKNKIAFGVNRGAAQAARMVFGWGSTPSAYVNPPDASGIFAYNGWWSKDYTPTFTEAAQNQIKQTVIGSITGLGLPAPSLVQIQIKLDFDKDVNLVKLTAVVDGLQLIGAGPFIPPKLSMTETAVAILPNRQPPGIVQQGCPAVLSTPMDLQGLPTPKMPMSFFAMLPSYGLLPTPDISPPPGEFARLRGDESDFVIHWYGWKSNFPPSSTIVSPDETGAGVTHWSYKR